MTDTGVVTIHGKEYRTVAARISLFREEHKDWRIETSLISGDDERIVMKAMIFNPEVSAEYPVSTGYAEEIRDASTINKTSALENCETSAVGRALAFIGLAGTEIASADEVAQAITQQKEKEAVEHLIAHQNAVKANWDSIVAIKEKLRLDELPAAWEAYLEISDDDKIALRVAPTKGGIWTVEENKKLKQAAEDDFDPESGVYKSVAG